MASLDTTEPGRLRGFRQNGAFLIQWNRCILEDRAGWSYSVDYGGSLLCVSNRVTAFEHDFLHLVRAVASDLMTPARAWFILGAQACCSIHFCRRVVVVVMEELG